MDAQASGADTQALKAALATLKGSVPSPDGYGVAIKTLLTFINNIKNHPQGVLPELRRLVH